MKICNSIQPHKKVVWQLGIMVTGNALSHSTTVGGVEDILNLVEHQIHRLTHKLYLNSSDDVL